MSLAKPYQAKSQLQAAGLLVDRSKDRPRAALRHLTGIASRGGRRSYHSERRT